MQKQVEAADEKPWVRMLVIRVAVIEHTKSNKSFGFLDFK